MAYYVKFELFIPKWPREQADSDIVQLVALLTRGFLEFAEKKYGGFTGWNPAVPGLVGSWNSDGEPILDELAPVWVLVETGVYEEALQDFSQWQEIFEEMLHQQVVLVTDQLIRTIKPLTRTKDLPGQLKLFPSPEAARTGNP